MILQYEQLIKRLAARNITIEIDNCGNYSGITPKGEKFTFVRAWTDAAGLGTLKIAGETYFTRGSFGKALGYIEQS